MQRPGGFSSIFILASFVALALSTLALYLVEEANLGEGAKHGWAVAVFLWDLLAMNFIVFGFGYSITGFLSGVLINGLNQYSLSKLQMALWTILVLAAVAVAAKINLLGYFGPKSDALNIDIPGDLLAALGIAAFTTSAAPAILALKSAQAPPSQNDLDAAKQRFSDATGTSADDVHAKGQAIARSDPINAAWVDIVAGDEVANAGTVDISKVQQLLITLLLLGAYLLFIIKLLVESKGPIAGLPSLSPRFIELLALSHAGYLAYKVAPKSPPATSDKDQATASAREAASDSADAAASPDTVTLRLVIDDIQDLQAVALTVDNKEVDVPQNGFVELTLAKQLEHALDIRAKRGGVAVSAHRTIIGAPGDVDLVQEIALV